MFKKGKKEEIKKELLRSNVSININLIVFVCLYDYLNKIKRYQASWKSVWLN